MGAASPSDSSCGTEAPSEHAGLHPLLLHHILNTLGWPALRTLQRAAVRPVLSGSHVLLSAPTAGGKTEAAAFPILSRMLSEGWAPLSVLYLCPLRALLNNLHPRIARYADLVGRRAGLWHGDIGEREREAIRQDPPDILLTTPESIEAMLVSGKTDHAFVFRNLRCIVVDEVHAFAGDDRGWHLVAVAQRLQHLVGREVQRVGLSATVGNPDRVLDWLSRTGRKERIVVAPPEEARPAAEVTLDYVGNLENAAAVVSRLHRGEKRLAFVDSRSRVEQLAVALRGRGVETYVSHGSLGREERRAAEKAFAESRDCVIVATSTLELGIDVGDLDRVIQIDAPGSVASFLQRLGRTGRREGQPSNALLLATRKESFLQALGLMRRWEEGYVEPLEPSPLPLHLAVQQILALVLQERGVGRRTWRDWFGKPFVLGEDVGAHMAGLVDHLVAAGFLFEDNGILGVGERGSRVFGGRSFLELMAVFSEPPMLRVLAGRTEIGQVPERLLTVANPDGHVVLLAGRHWHVQSVDWKRGTVHVEPSSDPGKAMWIGEGRGLSFALCQGLKEVLAGDDLTKVHLSKRARWQLEDLRDRYAWVGPARELTLLTSPGGQRTLWTFAGSQVNTWLAAGLGDLTEERVPGDLNVRLVEGAEPAEAERRLRATEPGKLRLGERVENGAIERLKFAEALPEEMARLVVETRLRDDERVREVVGWELRIVGQG